METAVEAQTKAVLPHAPLARTAASTGDSATVGQFKTAISRCVDAALNQHPINFIGSSGTEERAKTFASTLSGYLESLHEQELADKVFSIFKRSDT